MVNKLQIPLLKIPLEEYTSPNPIVVDREAALSEVEGLMRANGIRHIPVVGKDKKIVGIISDRDVKMARRISDADEYTAEEIMTPDPVTFSSQRTLDEVAFEMVKSKISSVIVEDEAEEFVGIFTSTDALNALIEIVRGVSPGR